jgi:hypothetical protein
VHQVRPPASPPPPPTYLALAHLQLVIHHQNHLELLCRCRGSEAGAAPPAPPHRLLLPLLAVIAVVLILPLMLRQAVMRREVARDSFQVGCSPAVGGLVSCSRCRHPPECWRKWLRWANWQPGPSPRPHLALLGEPADNAAHCKANAAP